MLPACYVTGHTLDIVTNCSVPRRTLRVFMSRAWHVWKPASLAFLMSPVGAASTLTQRSRQRRERCPHCGQCLCILWTGEAHRGMRRVRRGVVNDVSSNHVGALADKW